VRGRVWVLHGRVAVGNKSCTSRIKPLVEFGRAWSGYLGDRDDRVDLIGSVYVAIEKVFQNYHASAVHSLQSVVYQFIHALIHCFTDNYIRHCRVHYGTEFELCVYVMWRLV